MSEQITRNPALNSRVPENIETCFFEPGIFRSVPWTYAELGLKRDEFAYLMKGFLRCNNPANPNRHWWSYAKQAADLGVGKATISFINQLLENSGIIFISRKKGRSNVYHYNLVRPDQLELYRSIVDEERGKLDRIYTHNGTFRDKK